MLARPELEQLAQRVIARYHLGSLTEQETGSYIAHRMAVAGGGAVIPFKRNLMPRIHQITHGVPRRINLLCDRALLGAYVENSREVTRAILRRAAGEVFTTAPPKTPPVRKRWPVLAAGALAAVVVSAAAAWQLMPQKKGAGGANNVVPAVASAAKAVVAVAAAPLAHTDEQRALHELARLWGKPLPEGDACQSGMKANLRCHQGRGGLYDVRQLDRPAVLTLRDGADVSYALVIAMDNNSATLQLNGRQQKMGVADLALRFDGAYTTYWKMPRYYRDQVGEGEQGADVDWIAASLAHLNGTQRPPQNRALGAETLEQLRRFQQEQHLKADGVAGPRTYMRLNQLAGVPEPRLATAHTVKQ